MQYVNHLPLTDHDRIIAIVGILGESGVMRLGSTAGLVRGDWGLFIVEEVGYADTL